MTENLYKPKKKTDAAKKATKQDATPAITEATNAAGDVFKVGDLVETGLSSNGFYDVQVTLANGTIYPPILQGKFTLLKPLTV